MTFVGLKLVNLKNSTINMWAVLTPKPNDPNNCFFLRGALENKQNIGFNSQKRVTAESF